MSVAFCGGGACTPESGVVWRSDNLPPILSLKPDRTSASLQQADACTVGLPSATPLVTLLMCTFDGVNHIEDQLQSVANQTYAKWHLVVSDDGSTDGTLEKLNRFACRFKERVELRHGPRTCSPDFGILEARQFATSNFLSLATDRTIVGDYFAYCDQDDEWMPHKLERAVKWLSTVPKHVPALYCSRSYIMDAGGELCGLSPLFNRPPSFCNALVQSIGGGNTMVFNQAARALLAEAGIVSVVAHDWWTYLLVSGAGGIVHYDREPCIKYRQHSQNLVGFNQSFKAIVQRLRMVSCGNWARWTDLNLAALQRSARLLTPTSSRLLGQVGELRRGSLSMRVGMLTHLRLYRQTLLGQLALSWAVLTSRV